MRRTFVFLFAVLPVFSVQAAPASQETSPPPTQSPIQISFPQKDGIKFSTLDGETSETIRGYIQAYNVNFNGNDADTVNHIANLNNGLLIPSSRVEILGVLHRVWNYRFSYDFAFSKIAYAYWQYTGINHFEIMAGQYKPAFSLGFLTDRVDNTFMARPLPVEAFTAGFAMGLQTEAFTKNWTFTGGVFGPNSADDINGQRVVGSAPIGFNGRVTYAPIHDPRRVLHFGLGNYYRQTILSRYAQFRSTPEMLSANNIADGCLVNTGVINNSNEYDVSNAEVAIVAGSFSVESEYFYDRVNRTGNNPTLTFGGGYIAASYFLTGENRVYDFLLGDFNNISRIRHGYGAWEMAARLSEVNLDSQNIIGGKEDNATVALDYYPIQRIKLALNYVYADATPSGNRLNRHSNIIGVMLQALF